MTQFFSANVSALDQSVAFAGIAFIHNGITYRGIVNFLSTFETIDFGGFQSHLSATIAVSCATMSVAPAKGDKITIASVDRRVIDVTNNNQISWHISLEDISR